VKSLSRSGHQLDKVIKFLCKVGLDLVVTLPRSKKLFECGGIVQMIHQIGIHHDFNFLEVKKPDSKTLKFSGEEKNRRALLYARPANSRKFLDTVIPSLR
jgi:hypothetical protein